MDILHRISRGDACKASGTGQWLEGTEISWWRGGEVPANFIATPGS